MFFNSGAKDTGYFFQKMKRAPEDFGICEMEEIEKDNPINDKTLYSGVRSKDRNFPCIYLDNRTGRACSVHGDEDTY